MPAAQPRLRDDLLVSKQETRDETFFVVKDPTTRRFFRLREAEYYVARQLDGASPLEAVRGRVATTLGEELEPDELEGFVAQLRRQGLLAPEGEHGAPAARGGLLRGNLLWLRVKAIDPHRLFEWLLPRVRVCFTPGFVTLAAMVILVGVAIVLTSGAQIAAEVRSLWSPHGLLLAWVTILGVTVLHEFAHGLTCRHFGGEVREIGFLLIYFQPAFYCNVSDSWLFPEKSKRLWVMAAGGFFELFVWGLAAIVWRIAEPGTWLGVGALAIVLTSAVRQFFNLNPLIKLDGYYLLSDALEVPNLRGRAFEYLTARFKRALGLSAPPVGDPSPRERRIFIAYGLLAMTFSYWLLTSFALHVAGSLTRHYQGWGFLAFAGAANLALGNPLKKVVPPAPRRLAAVPRRYLVPAVLAALAALLALVRVELTASGELRILPLQHADLRAQIEGVVERVYVDEGARVAAGDTIALLAARDDEAQLRVVEARIGAQRSRLALLRAGPRGQEVDVARLAVLKADEHLRYAAPELDRQRALAAARVATRLELEQAQERVAVLTKEREEAQGRLELMLAGTRPESLAALGQEIASAEAERQRLAQRLAHAAVIASHGGVVATPRLRERVGRYVKAGDSIAVVDAVDTVTAEIAVPEREIGDVRVGQPGVLRLRAYPERAFQGRVTAIAPAAEEHPAAGRVMRVRIALPNDSGLVKPEMSGYARIYCGKRPALDVLTRRFRRYLRVEFWSWW
ncbi:MAG TPA: efflux RND transporter periplasmic adaptor subunit [Gemmatimonadaceae bacterium]|nr:efflux RND transporter periplasmic adaptor subunit [Gemmatimonadaceae bacterium]